MSQIENHKNRVSLLLLLISCMIIIVNEQRHFREKLIRAALTPRLACVFKTYTDELGLS
jgi:hypothetical protein